MLPTRDDYFRDRIDAGEQLADALAPLRGRHPLILAIPRGGVPIGRIVADRLDGELDVVLVRKIGAPGHAEFAVGAVDEGGALYVSPDAALAGADDRYVRQEAARQQEVMRARRALYSPHHAAIDPAGRIVVIVDDGLATGATMRAALQAIRARRPARVVCAVPVASPRSLPEVADLTDDLVCLSAPDHFRSVGEFYLQFPDVEDDQVIRLLGRASAPPAVRAEAVRIAVDGIELDGDLEVPDSAAGLVIFAHGSGSNRMSARNRRVSEALHARGLATLLFDLLTGEEARQVSERFDIAKLASRLDAALQWATRHAGIAALPVGLFGASTGAAAALALAARRPAAIKAVVSRGGRPDLASGHLLAAVRAPTLLIVGAADTEVIALNREALAAFACPAKLVLVPHATHLFEEPGTLEAVARLAADWFARWLPGDEAMPVPA